MRALAGLFNDPARFARRMVTRRTLVAYRTIESPTHLVFGANTDVGKTLVVGGLLRESVVHSGLSARYIKPIQCGKPYDEDFVKKYCTPHHPGESECAIVPSCKRAKFSRARRERL